MSEIGDYVLPGDSAWLDRSILGDWPIPSVVISQRGATTLYRDVSTLSIFENCTPFSLLDLKPILKRRLLWMVLI